MDMEELKEIRNILERGPVKSAALGEYLTKAKNFLNIKPSSISKQTMPEFEKEQEWARFLLSNYRNYLINQNVIVEDRIYDEQKINRVLPSVSKKQLGNSVTEIYIGNEIEEAFF